MSPVPTAPESAGKGQKMELHGVISQNLVLFIVIISSNNEIALEVPSTEQPRLTI
jgi:hypothetical protein